MNFKNKIIWTLTDGSQGMISQVNGLAQQLGNNIKSIKTELRFPWSVLQPGIIPIYSWIFKNKIDLSNKPDLVISCGRKSVYLSVYLKKIFSKEIITIHIQNPKISSSNFDFLVIPNHDKISGNNIIRSIGAIHHFTEENIVEKDILDIPKKNLVSVLVGGSNRHYNFSIKIIYDLIKKIKNIKIKNPKYNILIIHSRRTNKKFIKLFQNELKNYAEVWNGEDNNPYVFALKNSFFFIVTSDSTSMISECAFSGKPIYIFHLPFKRKSIRIKSFHEEFENRKITKNFSDISDLKEWKYKTFNEAKRISGILKERIIEGFDVS